MRSARFGSLGHLARRFIGSLRSTPPSAPDDAWAESQLLPAESALWRRLSGPDRRHAVATGRAVAVLLGGESAAGRAVLSAALLHDVGKVQAGLGTFGRAAVTATAMVFGPDRVGRIGGRPARYLRHGRLGADMLAAAGSDPLAIAWATEHHLAPFLWTVPRAVGEALKVADDE